MWFWVGAGLVREGSYDLCSTGDVRVWRMVGELIREMIVQGFNDINDIIRMVLMRILVKTGGCPSGGSNRILCCVPHGSLSPRPHTAAPARIIIHLDHQFILQ